MLKLLRRNIVRNLLRSTMLNIRNLMLRSFLRTVYIIMWKLLSWMKLLWNNWYFIKIGVVLITMKFILNVRLGAAWLGYSYWRWWCTVSSRLFRRFLVCKCIISVLNKIVHILAFCRILTIEVVNVCLFSISVMELLVLGSSVSLLIFKWTKSYVNDSCTFIWIYLENDFFINSSLKLDQAGPNNALRL